MGYVVTFEEPDAVDGAQVAYTTPHGQGTSPASPRPASRGDDGVVYSAALPRDVTSYVVDGRGFDVHQRNASRLRVAVLADMGRSDASWAIWERVAAQQPDLVLIAGDVSYANGNGSKWDQWFARVESVASRVPVMVAMGNHETYCSPDGVELKACAKETYEYLEHFHMPTPQNGSMYYDFDLGPAHFTALDTEAYQADLPDAPRTDAHAQNAFLDASLASAADAWRIVYFHRPLYSSNAHERDIQDLEARADWLPSLDARGADLVLNGHAHAYERTYAMRSGEVVSGDAAVKAGTGTFFVTTGGGGRSLYGEFGPRPAWSAVRAAEYEFVLLDITNDSLVGRALREDGSVLDAFAIYRGTAPTLPELSTQGGTHPTPAVNLPAMLVGLTLALVLAGRTTRRRPRPPRRP